MAFRCYKPETIARNAAEHQANRVKRHEMLLARLRAKVAECGPDSIYGEMLAEMEASK